ncbi:hypothetical protein [Streptomyces sp. NBC_01428]|uniref:hypothetical protein n=1 Tax=Streptomyces sp. NBC_01428 TaxID=2903861 RepID=UPI002E33BE5A|nr:hypothetical protein [Streptomyces sp. NBC_01428]
MPKQTVPDAASQLGLPVVHEQALKGLKFNAALPRRLAEARLADLEGAVAVLDEPVRFSSMPG